MNSPDTPSVTFSLASEAGPSPWHLPDGRVIAPSGLAAALASLSARQVAAMGLQISGIYGPLGSTSSASAALASSLASKLRQQLGTAGSTLFRQTWKAKATPAGRQYWAHIASAHRTSDSGFTSWPTPIVNDTTGSTHCYSGKNPDGSRRVALKLPGAALAACPTPVHHNAKQMGYPAEFTRATLQLGTLAFLASWPTPAASDEKPRGSFLDGAIQRRLEIGKQISLSMIAGAAQPGSPVSTEKRGSLNPALSRWLMGYPPAWCDSAPTETPSSRKRRLRLSEPT